MRKAKEVRLQGYMLAGLALVLVAILMLFFDHFSIVSFAQSTGKVTATVNIRAEASTSSSILGSAEEGKEISITGKTTGSDGKVWYQVFVNSTTLGFIHSDYVTVTEGTPSEVSGTSGTGSSGTGTGTITPSDPDTGNGEENPPASEEPGDVATGEVIEAQPVSAKAGGTEAEIRVRSTPSEDGEIVAQLQEGEVLTVNGYVLTADDVTWFRVNFLSNNESVTGFIHENYIFLDDELIPLSELPGNGDDSGQSGNNPGGDSEDADYTLSYNSEKAIWELYDYTGESIYIYDVKDLLETTYESIEIYKKNQSTITGQKIAIIILVVLVALLGFGVTFLYFKIKDISDEAYFSAVEKETINRRNVKKEQSGTGGRVMHSVGSSGSGGARTARPGGSQGQRPAGSGGQSRPVGSQGGQGSQGQSRPAGSQGSQGQSRPAGSQGMSQGQPRPAGGGGQSRPVGSQGGQGSQGQSRPVGSQGSQGQSRPAGSQGMSQGQSRPAGSQGMSQGQSRPVGSQGGQGGQGQPRPAGSQGMSQGQPRSMGSQGGQGSSRPQQSGKPEQQTPGWKSKNFMADENDEFEFEFLNWDGEEE